MFQSITYKNYLGYNETTKLYSYEYEITDSDLGVRTAAAAMAVAVAAMRAEVARVVPPVAVLSFYEENNLPVAQNLVRYFLFARDRWQYKIEDTISWNIKYNPKYLKYHEEVQKYLMLI